VTLISLRSCSAKPGVRLQTGSAHVPRGPTRLYAYTLTGRPPVLDTCSHLWFELWFHTYMPTHMTQGTPHGGSVFCFPAPLGAARLRRTARLLSRPPPPTEFTIPRLDTVFAARCCARQHQRAGGAASANPSGATRSGACRDDGGPPSLSVWKLIGLLALRPKSPLGGKDCFSTWRGDSSRRRSAETASVARTCVVGGRRFECFAQQETNHGDKQSSRGPAAQDHGGCNFCYFCPLLSSDREHGANLKRVRTEGFYIQ
jgi:hypothetical protein